MSDDKKIYVKSTRKIGIAKFGNHIIPVYGNLDEPLFKASDVAEFVGYTGPMEHFVDWYIKDWCESDEYIKIPYDDDKDATFLSEMGLYSILATTRSTQARLWRRVIHAQLIEMRKEHGLDISQQFEEWDHMIDDCYYDEKTGKLMMSITTPGGDVEQVEA